MISEKTDLCSKKICNAGFILSGFMLLMDLHGSNILLKEREAFICLGKHSDLKVVEPSIMETSSKCTQKLECKRSYSFLKNNMYITLILYYQVTL